MKLLWRGGRFGSKRIRSIIWWVPSRTRMTPVSVMCWRRCRVFRWTRSAGFLTWECPLISSTLREWTWWRTAMALLPIIFLPMTLPPCSYWSDTSPSRRWGTPTRLPSIWKWKRVLREYGLCRRCWELGRISRLMLKEKGNWRAFILLGKGSTWLLESPTIQERTWKRK